MGGGGATGGGGGDWRRLNQIRESSQRQIKPPRPISEGKPALAMSDGGWGVGVGMDVGIRKGIDVGNSKGGSVG